MPQLIQVNKAERKCRCYNCYKDDDLIPKDELRVFVLGRGKATEEYFHLECFLKYIEETKVGIQDEYDRLSGKKGELSEEEQIKSDSKVPKAKKPKPKPQKKEGVIKFLKYHKYLANIIQVD